MASTTIQLLNVFSGVITARALGPSGKGELTAVLLWPGILAALGAFGITEAVVFHGARARSSQKDIVGTGMVLTLMQAGLLVAVGALLVGMVLGRLGPTVLWTARLYLLWLPLSLLTLVAMAALQAKLELGMFNALRVTVIALMLIGLVSLVVVHRISVLNVVIVYLIANLITLVVSLWAIARRGWLSLHPNKFLLQPMLAFGAKSHTGNVAGLANERADMAVISVFLAPVYLGLYSVAVTMTSAIGLLGSSISMVTFPAVASAADSEIMSRSLARFVRTTLALSFLLALGLVAVMPVLITFFFGSPFSAATPVARVLVVAAVTLSTSRVIAAGLKAFNKPLVSGLAETGAAVVTVIGLAALVPLIGIMGAAVASLLAYSTSLAFTVWFCWRRFGIHPMELLVLRTEDLSWLVSRLHWGIQK